MALTVDAVESDMPYHDVICTSCSGSGKSALLDPSGNREFLCSVCEGTGKCREWTESAPIKDMEMPVEPRSVRRSKEMNDSASATLEKLAWDGTLADAVKYAWESKCPNQLFSDRRGNRISLLHLMAMAKSKPGIQVMLDIGADVNIKSSDGETPLQIAIIGKDPAIVHFLVEKGANVNVQGSRGSTPLATALINDCPEIAQYLLDHGADPDIRDDQGISARQIQNFRRLRTAAPKRPVGGGGLDKWLEALGDEPSEEALLALLEMSQSLLDLKVREGRMSRIKAQTLQRKIDEFKEVYARLETSTGDSASKGKRIREIINAFKTAFTEDLSR